MVLSIGFERAKPKLDSFHTPIGFYKRKRLPMGLASALEAFQNLIEMLRSGFCYEVVLLCLDDIIACVKTLKERLIRLQQVFA